MSTLTLGPRLFEPVGTLFDDPDLETVRQDQPSIARPNRASQAGGPTLDDVIAAGWEQITSGASASCPVCHGELRAVWAAGSRPVGGRCQDCGTRLS